MSDLIDNRRPSNGDLYARLDRMEDHLSRRLEQLAVKVDDDSARLDRMEGGIAMLRWLGPTGVVAVIFALAQAAGFVS